MLALVTNGFKSFPVSFTSTQAEDVMKRLTEEEWMTCLRLERRHPSHEIYQRSVTAERKHTDQIHHGAVGVFVLLRFFRCAPLYHTIGVTVNFDSLAFFLLKTYLP